MPACCEHVQARDEDEAWEFARSAAAAHGPGYRVQWVRPFDGIVRNTNKKGSSHAAVA
jgi:hypothetical protein